ncbi:MAG: hypothetical protein HYX57_10430 [Chloroflexi bacterium]|nr:hypothetical protein [Chloroflexota bacterium]
MRRLRHLLVSLSITGVLTLTMVATAVGHVHGITPLRCVGVAGDGANATNSTPAAAANGGPIRGLIPRDVGNAPITVGDGGFDTPACPA